MYNNVRDKHPKNVVGASPEGVGQPLSILRGGGGGGFLLIGEENCYFIIKIVKINF